MGYLQCESGPLHHLCFDTNSYFRSTPSTSTVSHDGSKHGKCVHSITETGSSKSTGGSWVGGYAVFDLFRFKHAGKAGVRQVSRVEAFVGELW